MLSLLLFVWMFRDSTPIPCDSWLAVESVTPGEADFHVLPHEPTSPYIYLSSWVCLHEPNHECPGGEWITWPDPDHVTFTAPLGGPYQLIVGKYVQDKGGEWVPTRACSTVEIEPTMSYER